MEEQVRALVGRPALDLEFQGLRTSLGQLGLPIRDPHGGPFAGMGHGQLGRAGVGPAVDEPGRAAPIQDLAALGDEFIQKGVCGGVEVLDPRGKDDQVVLLRPDEERRPVHLGPLAQNGFAAEVIFELGGLQVVDEALEGLADGLDLVRVAGRGIIHPGGGGRLEDEDAVILPAGRHGQREPAQVIAHHPIIVPPRLVIGERLGVVALAGPHDGHIRKMRIDEVDAEGELPIGDPFLIEKAQVPSAGAVGLRHRPRPAGLVAGAAQLLDRPGIAELGVDVGLEIVHQDVDAGHVRPGLHGHAVRADGRARPLVLPVMAGEDEIVAGAIFRIGFGPAFDEEIQQQGVIIVAHAHPIARFLEERRQIDLQVVAPFRLEGGEEAGRPVDDNHILSAGRADFGLVLERAGNDRTEIGAERILIGVQSHLQELGRDVRAHDIDIGEAAIPGAGLLFVDVEDRVFARARILPLQAAGDVDKAVFGFAQHDDGLNRKDLGQFGFLGQAQAGTGGVRHGRRDVPAAEPGRVGVLVVDPDFHPQPAAGVHGVLEEVQPFGREVGRDQPGTGMDERAADALGLEIGQLFVDLGLGDPVVPDPERRGAVFRRRIGEERLERGQLIRGKGHPRRKRRFLGAGRQNG